MVDRKIGDGGIPYIDAGGSAGGITVTGDPGGKSVTGSAGNISATGRSLRFRVGPKFGVAATLSALASFVAGGAGATAATFSTLAAIVVAGLKRSNAAAPFSAKAAFIAPGSKAAQGLATVSSEATFIAVGVNAANGNDAYTKFLAHFDGADGSQTFTDSSASAHAITANGNVQIDTAQSKFGGASGLFDGNGDYLSAPANADFDFGTGDFTIDFWVRFNAIPGGFQWFINLGSTTLIGSPAVDLGRISILQGAATIFSGAGSTAFATNTWYHIAIVRSSNNWIVFRDGSSYVTTTYSGSFGTASESLLIGGNASSYYLNGWLEELRISKGIARWTSNFTPPAAPYS